MGWHSGWGGRGLWLLGLGLLAGCAASGGAGGEPRYGAELGDVQEAIQRGEGRQALAFHQRAAAELEGRGRTLEAARSRAAAASLGWRLGAYEVSIREGLRAAELFRAAHRTEETVWRLANALTVVGQSYKQAGDLAAAARALQAGLEATGAFTDVERILFWRGHFLRNLADVAYAEGDYGRALALGREAVDALEEHVVRLPAEARTDETGRVVRSSLAATLALAGNAERRTGRLADSEATLGRARALARELGIVEVEAGAVGSLGWTALARGDARAALARFDEARALGQRLDHAALLMSVETGAARSLDALGRGDEALEAFGRAMALVEDLRGRLSETDLRAGFLDDKQAIYHAAVRAALSRGREAEAFGFAERARARAFLDLLGSHTVLSRARTRALAGEETRLRAELTEAQALLRTAGAAERATARSRLAAAETAYRGFLGRVRSESAEQASLMAVEPVTLAEVQRLIPEGVTLLEFLVTETETILWVVDRGASLTFRLALSRAELAESVGGLRRALSEHAPLAEVERQARALDERLLAPARPHLRAERLLLVPHDVLHYLPFAALRSPSGRWLVEDHELAVLPSASVLRYLEGKGRGAGGPVLALGNPELGPALALRYAEREARAVGQLHPGAMVLLGAEATEARIKELAPRARILHLATHGDLDERAPLRSALLLAPGGAEDGRLEVGEVLQLELGASLVVLSACETGLGRLSRGDELVGLQRAFLYAGTPAVITTLWKVDDRASFLLMREFHARLGAAGPAEALRHAQRATLVEAPHPFAWAGFVLAGRP
ncbi:MAG: hypothetical protein A2X52_17285 [Candidatus Rokubacteria bacterium GWC2_70_16]|nr:MAG: hypothetical protein A2X52_17285 [Candidatus Rokubacteria bacterium GWC2_70_16]